MEKSKFNSWAQIFTNEWHLYKNGESDTLPLRFCEVEVFKANQFNFGVHFHNSAKFTKYFPATSEGIKNLISFLEFRN